MAWAAVVIPLMAFAISAMLYVINKRAERLNEEARRLEELITTVNNTRADQGMAVMLIALSELERHRRYREAITRAVGALRANHLQTAPTSVLIPAEDELLRKLRRPTVPWGRQLP